MPRGSACTDKALCGLFNYLINLSQLLEFLANQLPYEESPILDPERTLILGEQPRLFSGVLPDLDKNELVEEKNTDQIITEISQLMKSALLAVDREGNTSPQRIREIRLEIIPILLQLELLERYFEQEETDIETMRQIENGIEAQIGSLLKILLYLPEQPQE